ncbi:MAG: tetratricopeptide repeat protein [Sulfurisoma sp.]|nr:tetratricopeptide repeat protein [Sulfurisoma sp.]
MSLVNKVLRDLDARRAGDTERGMLPSAVTPMHNEAAISRARIAALLAMSILAAGAVAAYLGFRPSPDLPHVTSVPAPPKIVAPPPQTPAVASAAVPVAAPADTLTPGLPALGDLALRLDVDLTRVPEPKKPAAAPVVASAKPAAKAAPAPAEKPAAPSAAPKAAPLAAAPSPATAVAVPDTSIDKQMRQYSAAEKAEAEFRRGQLAQRQGADDEAAARYRTALAEQPEHAAARRILASLLIEHRRHDEAEELLRGGIALFPVQASWPMVLSRLRVERGDMPGALDILKKHAAAGEASADYQGFAGALLHRGGQHAEAADRYRAASRLAPNEARWWAGLGIALESAGKPAEARAAYERARGLPGLPAELAAHIEQRLR